MHKTEVFSRKPDVTLPTSKETMGETTRLDCVCGRVCIGVTMNTGGVLSMDILFYSSVASDGVDTDES